MTIPQVEVSLLTVFIVFVNGIFFVTKILLR